MLHIVDEQFKRKQAAEVAELKLKLQNEAEAEKKRLQQAFSGELEKEREVLSKQQSELQQLRQRQLELETASRELNELKAQNEIKVQEEILRREKEILANQEEQQRKLLDLEKARSQAQLKLLEENLLKQSEENLNTRLQNERMAYEAELRKRDETAKEQAEQLKKWREQQLVMQAQEKELQEWRENSQLQIQEALLKQEQIWKAAQEEKAKRQLELERVRWQQKNEEEQNEKFFNLQRELNEQLNKRIEQEQLKQAELQKQLDDQRKLAEEMKKRAEQGSMQLQGEVQELALEELLRRQFPRDTVESVKTGVHGADCSLHVFTQMGQPAGSILFESKRTKSFSDGWIEKLKADMRDARADIAVLVTDIMPKDMDRFGERQGIWICGFHEVAALTAVLRNTLIQVAQIQAANENKSDKMQLLYAYLTGNDFRQNIEAIVGAFSAMQAQIVREERALTKQWKERKKQLEVVMNSTLSLYGNIRGIAGGAVQEVKALEMEQFLLDEPED